MISALLVSLLANQSDKAPETIDALQKRMAQDSRKLKTYRDSWLLTTNTPNSKVQMRILRSIDGPRCAVMALIDDRPILDDFLRQVIDRRPLGIAQYGGQQQPT